MIVTMNHHSELKTSKTILKINEIKESAEVFAGPYFCRDGTFLTSAKYQVTFIDLVLKCDDVDVDTSGRLTHSQKTSAH